MTTLILSLLGLGIYVAGIWTGRELFRPRADFRRLQLPPKNP